MPRRKSGTEAGTSAAAVCVKRAMILWRDLI
jgi:hypothetical protein